jgi:hypothetical protein
MINFEVLFYFPHWNLIFSKKEKIYLSWHLFWFLHVDKVLKELLYCWNLTHIFESVLVVVENIGLTLFLLVSIKFCLILAITISFVMLILLLLKSLHIPKVPCWLQWMSYLWHSIRSWEVLLRALELCWTSVDFNWVLFLRLSWHLFIQVLILKLIKIF